MILKEEDKGQYTCKGSNRYGSDSKTTNLILPEGIFIGQL